MTRIYESLKCTGYVNGLRSNLPLGLVDPSTVTYTSTNGCRIGTCAADASYGRCFEVTDPLKVSFHLIFHNYCYLYFDYRFICTSDHLCNYFER